MNLMSLKTTRNILIFLLPVLAACGGGGGGSTTTTTAYDTFFETPLQFDTTTFSITAVGDFNNDGLEDLVATSLGSGTLATPVGVPIRIYTQTGAGTFVDSTSTLIAGTIPETVVARHIEVADFNGDNIDDIYIGSHGLELGTPDQTKWHEQDVFLLSDPSNGNKLTDVMTTNMPTVTAGGRANTHSWYTHGLDTADIDGDGDIDLVINAVWSGAHVFKNNGAGTFALDTTYTQANLWVKFIEVNNDSRPDLFISDEAPAVGKIYLNNGAGGFANPINMPATILDWHVEDAHTADLNNDTYEDLIIGNSAKTTTPGTKNSIQILLNNKDNTFSDATSTFYPNQVDLAANGNPTFFMRDLDGNGADDVIYIQGDGVTNETGVFLNDGSTLSRVTTLSSIPLYFNLIKIGTDTNISVISSGSIEINGVWKTGTFLLRAKTKLQ